MDEGGPHGLLGVNRHFWGKRTWKRKHLSDGLHALIRSTTAGMEMQESLAWG